MDSDTRYLALALLVLGVTLFIYYFIIKSAVSTANQELLKEQRRTNFLLIFLLKGQGSTQDQIKEVLDEMNAPEKLKIQFEKGEINQEQYLERKKELLFEY
jgi:hypothetical protein